MRDDQRPGSQAHDDDQDDEFDDALDDLFDPDADEQPARPIPAQAPVPSPPSYDTTGAAPEKTPGQTSIPVASRKRSKDWRTIACFGCLALVGFPALCLAALIAYGLFVGDDETNEPPAVGVFVDPTIAETGSLAGDSPAGEQMRSIMDGRQAAIITVDGEQGYGVLDKPVPVGVSAPVGGGWELRINSVTENADQTVIDANTFNDPPAEGRQYVIANITVTRTTEPADLFEASFRLRAAGKTTGTVYTTFDTSDRCGVIPEPIPDLEFISGESASGNLCWQIRTDDLSALVLYNESFGEQDLGIWFDLTSS